MALSRKQALNRLAEAFTTATDGQKSLDAGDKFTVRAVPGSGVDLAPPPVPPPDDIVDQVVTEAEAILRGVDPEIRDALAGLDVIATVDWRVSDGSGQLLTRGDGYLADDGRRPLSLDLHIAPPVVELQEPADARLLDCRIEAAVTVSAGGDASDQMSLPEIVIPLAPLQVPKIAAFFRIAHFLAAVTRSGKTIEGFAFVVVPTNASSVIRDDSGASDVTELLSTPKRVADALARLARFAGLGRGLATLIDAIDDQPHVVVRRASRIDKLNRIKVIPSQGVEAEDEFSSLIFLGPPDSELHCFAATRCDGSHGRFDVRLGEEMVALVPVLTAAPRADLDALGGRAALPKKTSTVTRMARSDESGGRFHDAISSLRFG